MCLKQPKKKTDEQRSLQNFAIFTLGHVNNFCSTEEATTALENNGTEK